MKDRDHPCCNPLAHGIGRPPPGSCGCCGWFDARVSQQLDPRLLLHDRIRGLRRRNHLRRNPLACGIGRPPPGSCGFCGRFDTRVSQRSTRAYRCTTASAVLSRTRHICGSCRAAPGTIAPDSAREQRKRPRPPMPRPVSAWHWATASAVLWVFGRFDTRVSQRSTRAYCCTTASAVFVAGTAHLWQM